MTDEQINTTMNTYQRQLMHQLINELTATASPNLHAAQMLAAELKGAMKSQTELDDIHSITCDCAEPTPDADGWVENSGVDPKCTITAWRMKGGDELHSRMNSFHLSWGLNLQNATITHYKPA